MTPRMAEFCSSSSNAVLSCCQSSVFKELTGSLARAIVAKLLLVSTLRKDMSSFAAFTTVQVEGFLPIRN